MGAATSGAGARSAERPRSTVLITTSPPLLGSCDRVLFLADGGPVVGTHAELLERSDYAAAVLR